MSAPNVFIPGPDVADPTKVVMPHVEILEKEVHPEGKSDKVISTKSHGVLSASQARDLMEGNPNFTPFMCVIPWQLSQIVTMAVQHSPAFVRGPAAHVHAVLGLTPQIWQEQVVPRFPRFYPATADFVGELGIEGMDDGDYRTWWQDLRRMNKRDEHKYPLFFLGNPELPWFFVPVWMVHDKRCPDFAGIRSHTVDNRIVQADGSIVQA